MSSKNLDWVDEMFDDSSDDVELSWSTQTYLLHRLETSTIILDEHTHFQNLIISGKMPKADLEQLKTKLTMNQLPETQWWNPSQKAISKHIQNISKDAVHGKDNSSNQAEQG